MPGQLTSGPDPSKPFPSATAILRESPEDVSFETDFAELAARFSALGGGGLTAELSADLALEIVLNEIVEQACRSTGATGAAIVLEREGEMVCRASSGTTSPELGSRIDTQSGLAGECLKTRHTQCCDDALSDARADLEASERLGVRSVVVMPLLRGDHALGLFELFSTQPFAFGVRDERTLEALADRTVENLVRASQPPEPEPVAPAPQMPEVLPESPEIQAEENSTAVAESAEAAFTEAAQEVALEPGPPGTHRRDLVVWSLGAAVIAAAVLLGIVLGGHLALDRSSSKGKAALSAETVSSPSRNASAPTPDRQKLSGTAPKTAPAAQSARRNESAPGSLVVFEKGKEVFRSEPGGRSANHSDTNGGMELAADVTRQSVPTESPVPTGRDVLRRVEPEYPAAAREQGIEGQVVLDVHIAGDGNVQGIQVVSGPAVLADASRDAVRQWKFQPNLVDGQPVEMQTRVTLNFKLKK